MHSAVAKRWGGVGRLVKFVGLASVDAMAAMEKRGLHPAPGTFKEVEGITPDRLRDIVGYMDGTKSTLPGLKKIIKDVKKAQMWSWHILHPEAVTNGLVTNTRGMFWSNRDLYSNKSTDLAEISASLCVVQLMHNRSPPCDTTCLQLHLVLLRWPKGSALLHHT